ncbi:MAG TPA: deoxyribose-phosphate aldolase [Chloroflexia bacterium]|nr:deoxyribose-phosphate aldolase [Chloroflexia bacterium]
MIDHTQLKPDATEAMIVRLCEEARFYSFASVCINPVHVKLCVRELAGSNVRVCTVVGFPLGANMTSIKVSETQTAINHGAKEIDMVINIGALKAGQDFIVKREIAEVANHAHTGRGICKVIIEACLLDEAEKIRACELARDAGADFVKTSTGFSLGGATEDDVRLMRRVVGNKLGVKAAGGIRTLADAQRMIAAGATRLGSSSSVRIMQELYKANNSEAPEPQQQSSGGY